MKNVFRTLLVLSVVLGLVSISIAQTKPRMKKGTTTKRVVPLVPVGTDLKVRINDTLSSKDSRIGDRFTATVIDPSRFDEARVNGHISSIDSPGSMSFLLLLSAFLFMCIQHLTCMKKSLLILQDIFLISTCLFFPCCYWF